MHIPRTLYLEKVRPFYNQDLIKAIVGLRRSGKSVLMEQIRQELEQQNPDGSFLSLNMELLETLPLRDGKALHEHIKTHASQHPGKLYLFIDEVHHVSDWMTVLNSLRTSLDCDIYVTGSNAARMEAGLCAQANGRYITIQVYPFSFAEFKELYQASMNDCPDPQTLFSQYLILGGMPFLHHLHFDPTACMQYLDALYDEIVLKDILLNNAVRNPDLLERLFLYWTKTPGSHFSATSLSRYLKSTKGKGADPETICAYLRYGENAYIFLPVAKTSLHTKEILKQEEKIYIADHGLRQARTGDNQKDIQLILENLVCLEGLRRGYRVTAGSFHGKEVDFVMEKGGRRLYVQVTYLLASEETIEREFSVLESLPDAWPKYVVSMDPIDQSRNGVRHQHITTFLTEDWQ